MVSPAHIRQARDIFMNIHETGGRDIFHVDGPAFPPASLLVRVSHSQETQVDKRYPACLSGHLISSCTIKWYDSM